MPPARQTRHISIKIDTKNARQINALAKQMGVLNRNTRSMATDMRRLSGVFAGWISFLGVRELARLSDEMQNVSNRTKLFSKVGEDNSEIMKGLLDIADETKQSVGDVGVIYSRLGVAMQQAGASSEVLSSVTKTLINSFRLAGATSSETTATIIQLSQAFASGELRGQELRSVMEQNATLAVILQDRYRHLGGVYKAAEKGMIGVVDVLNILWEQEDRINENAKTLTITFEQVLTKAVNKLQFSLFELNTELKLTEKAAFALDVVVNKFGLFLTLIGVAAATQIPRLITQIKALSIAMFTLAKSNPLILALSAAVTLAAILIKDLDDLIDRWRNMIAWMKHFHAGLISLTIAAEKATFNFKVRIGQSADVLNERIKDMEARMAILRKEAIEYSTPRAGRSKDEEEKRQKEERDRIRKFYEDIKKTASGPAKLKNLLGNLNKEFLSGSITLGEYNQKLLDFELYKINREFKEGKFNAFEFHKRLGELDIVGLNNQLKDGEITFSDYNRAIRTSNIKKLHDEFESGRISLIKYNQEFVKLTDSPLYNLDSAWYAGVSSYVEGVGTLSSGIAEGIKGAFSALENSFTDFVKNGKFNFKQFTQAVLDDLARIIVRAAIIGPIAEGLLGGRSYGLSGSGTSYGSGGGPGPNYALPSAHGNVFDGGLKKFAKGGIVSGPTMFPYRGGQGLMGEAGPEAIIPLRRGRGGDLGVEASVTPVTVNVINQSGNDVDQRETTGPNGERLIEILIHGKVREGIVAGKFDRAFQQSFGLSRKGS